MPVVRDLGSWNDEFGGEHAVAAIRYGIDLFPILLNLDAVQQVWG